MTDRLERLINLVIALRETRRPMTVGEIHERVAGYADSEGEAFRRMFERDKSDLRDLGVPIETVPTDFFDDRLGYRIDPRQYDLPPVSFEAAELAALALAVSATGLADEAGTGLLKLQVGAGEPDATRLRPDAQRLAVALDAPHRDTLVRAQVTRTAVRFTYRPLGRTAAVRTVDPYALIHRRGRWYVVGHDHDRDEERAFRLDRIEGRVRTIGQEGAFAPPAGGVDPDVVVPVPAGDAPETAEVVASAAVAWQVARRARGGGEPVDDERTQFTVAVGDVDDFVFWTLQFGPDLVVTGPPAIRDVVMDRLRQMVETT